MVVAIVGVGVGVVMEAGKAASGRSAELRWVEAMTMQVRESRVLWCHRGIG